MLRAYRLVPCAALIGLSGYYIRHIREAETILPDYDQLAMVADEDSRGR